MFHQTLQTARIPCNCVAGGGVAIVDVTRQYGLQRTSDNRCHRSSSPPADNSNLISFGLAVNFVSGRG
jgi:hypothetical protein